MATPNSRQASPKQSLSCCSGGTATGVMVISVDPRARGCCTCTCTHVRTNKTSLRLQSTKQAGRTRLPFSERFQLMELSVILPFQKPTSQSTTKSGDGGRDRVAWREVAGSVFRVLQPDADRGCRPLPRPHSFRPGLFGSLHRRTVAA